MVLHDTARTVIFSACRSLRSYEEALKTELMAFLEGLELAVAHNSLPIIIDLVCSHLISAILATSHDRSPYLHIISNIQALARGCTICNFVKVDQNHVRISHCLANWARENLTMFWVGSGPKCFVQALEALIPIDQ
jgi:hypothetical protein